MKNETIKINEFFKYNIAKNIIMAIGLIIIMSILAFLYIFFVTYNSYKPRVVKVNQNYTLDINFSQLKAFQQNFFALKGLDYKTDKQLLYKIYDWPVISNSYDKAKARIIEWKKHITEQTTIIKKRVVNENKLANVLQSLKRLKKWK